MLAVGLAVAGASQAIAGSDVEIVDESHDTHDSHDAHDSRELAHETASLEGSDLDVVQGEEAVEQLEQSGTLDAVAADVGLAAEELRNELLEDSALFVTGSGYVGYADTLHEESPEPADASALSAAALPANVFGLSSRPSSSRVLYLDFNGHSTNDPAWGGVVNSLPFDLDGAPGSFSVAEQSVIYEVWQRVAEDYRPFDVNVTTRDPGVEGLRRSSVFDAAFGQRLVITPSNFTSSANVIGVAIVGSFDATVDRAAYVFTETPFKQTARTIGEAASHEVGHTFGLYHDGGPESPDYYDGHGSWAPIMGRPLDPTKPVTQWSRGEYAEANRFEDDLAIIAALTGYRPDDHSDSVAAPSVVPSNSVTLGNIGRTGDRDVFAVDVLAGSLSVQLRPPAGESAWSNLAARMTVRNGSGGVVATATPSSPSGWSLSVGPAVPAGRYTIEVAPIGWLTASTGFTTYGSLGAYQLVVNAPQGPPPLADGASAFTAITPVRLVDSRTGIGTVGRVGAGRQVIVPIANKMSVPANATAAVVNVAAVTPSAAGFVTVHPCSPTVPNTSTLNFVAGQTVANTTIAALSGSGQLCVWTDAETDILVDITGWLGPSGSTLLTPIGPRRVVDTRSGVGGFRLGAGATLAVDVSGVVPGGSSAVAVNVTAVNALTAGFLTVFPCSAALPNTSTVNFVAGEARPNNTIVGLTAGRLCVYSDTATDVLVDLVGAYGPSGLGYLPTPPDRVLDTRSTAPLSAGQFVGYGVGGAALAGQIPGAAYVNVTAVNHPVDGYVTTYNCVTRPDTSTLNLQVGQATANGAIVPLSALRSCAWTFGGGDLIVDLNGWWVP
jgi:hypothetical protein